MPTRADSRASTDSTRATVPISMNAKAASPLAAAMTTSRLENLAQLS